ncbi:MAG TPA: N-acyl homoserine lactonase family protein [Aggregatilineales bacterium]|nr:N-acyl homoserine lactonase family protein [Aggregatilineales bacterium]
MRIHAIKTGDVLVKTAFLGSPATAGGVAPYMAGLFTDRTTLRIPIYAWAIEHSEGVIVVDTGEHAGNSKSFLIQSRIDVRPEEEIGQQLKRLGISRADIAKVVMTHLHGDHADGLKDFEGVPVWISQREYKPFQARGFSMSKLGLNLPTWLDPMLIAFRNEALGPFEASLPLTSDGTVMAVPTPGHTAGHLSVIVRTDDVHYFIAGDVAYREQALLDQKLEGPTMEIDLHRDSLRRVLDYVRTNPTVFLPSHDPESAARLAAKQIVARTEQTVERTLQRSAPILAAE